MTVWIYRKFNSEEEMKDERGGEETNGGPSLPSSPRTQFLLFDRRGWFISPAAPPCARVCESLGAAEDVSGRRSRYRGCYFPFRFVDRVGRRLKLHTPKSLVCRLGSWDFFSAKIRVFFVLGKK